MEKVLFSFSFGRDAFGENQVLARNLICRKKGLASRKQKKLKNALKTNLCDSWKHPGKTRAIANKPGGEIFFCPEQYELPVYAVK